MIEGCCAKKPLRTGLNEGLEIDYSVWAPVAPLTKEQRQPFPGTCVCSSTAVLIIG